MDARCTTHGSTPSKRPPTLRTTFEDSLTRPLRLWPRSAESRRCGEAWATPGRSFDSSSPASSCGELGYRSRPCSGHDPVFIVIGVLVGHFVGIYLVYVRAINKESAEAEGGERDAA